MNKLRRTVASGIAMVTVAAGLCVVVASPAAAGTVVVTYNCGNPWVRPHDRVIEVTITAPATASPRQTVTVTANRLLDRNHVENEPVPAGTYAITMRIKLGGTASGEVETTRMTNPNLAAGEHTRFENGTAQVTMPAAGEVTFLPGQFYYWRHGVTCFPESVVAARTRVQ